MKLIKIIKMTFLRFKTKFQKLNYATNNNNNIFNKI